MMAKTKLTLTVDPEVIERAKQFAEQHATSISSLVEEYLRRISVEHIGRGDRLPPLVARLRGLGRPSGGREEYRRRLEEKYGR
jgi:hypothetical protein